MENSTIVIKNELLCLTLGTDGQAKSLLYLPTGEELLARTDTPFFSVTQERPYNNEVKLSHPCKKTTYSANRLREENGCLIVGFDIVPYEAVVEILCFPRFLAFRLRDFIVHPSDYPGLCMKTPPVSEFRLIALPVKPRRHFGVWLNVMWDEKVCVNVLAACPETRIESEERDGYRLLTADADAEIRLRGTTAGLIVDAPETFLDSMAAFENAFGLPAGADSRRSPDINASAYWVGDLRPENADAHIRLAKAGGFRMMLCYYTCFFKESGGYGLCGNYDYLPAYPNGAEDVARLLSKLRAAGITPGIHFLQTHIGLRSRYVTPVADHRLHLTRRFTLAAPLGKEDDTVFVEEEPRDPVMDERCRVLRFGGELLSYEGCTEERPYRFYGIRRGAFGTTVTEHPSGECGGILDVSEFGGTSVYIDQSSGLQDEIADKLAEIYRAGFAFVYFDGSEGANAPFAYHIPMAQYRVWKKLSPAPLYCEGAAKAHFSWHFLSGGNAFDVFPPHSFKEMLAEHPMKEAPRMREDFTRLNFGWWGLWNPGTQCDLVEYGESRSAAWDCPVSIQANLGVLESHPRIGDILETMRRWEDVRRKGWLTEEQKEALRDPRTEHTLLINETGEYELVPYTQIAGDQTGEAPLRAFLFERRNKNYVVFWCTGGTVRVKLPLRARDTAVQRTFSDRPVSPDELNGCVVLTVSDRQYLSSCLPAKVLTDAFRQAEIIVSE